MPVGAICINTQKFFEKYLQKDLDVMKKCLPLQPVSLKFC